MRGASELVDLCLPGQGSRLRVEHAVKIIESLMQLGSLDVQHLHVRNSATLVVVNNNNITVGRDIVRGLEPVGITLGLSCSRIGSLVRALTSMCTIAAGSCWLGAPTGT